MWQMVVDINFMVTWIGFAYMAFLPMCLQDTSLAASKPFIANGYVPSEKS